MWGQGAKALAAGKMVPLLQGVLPELGLGSGLGSSPSELLMLELELERGLGPRPARQAKRKGPPGKIPFREFSRQ